MLLLKDNKEIHSTLSTKDNSIALKFSQENRPTSKLTSLDNSLDSFPWCTMLQELLLSNQKAKEDFLDLTELHLTTLFNNLHPKNVNIFLVSCQKLKSSHKLILMKNNSFVILSKNKSSHLEVTLWNKDNKEIVSTLLLKESWLLKRKKVMLLRSRKSLSIRKEIILDKLL